METAQAVNPIKSLSALGQSIWLDYIRRDMLINGELTRLIKEDGLCGMTSNPAIFEKAIGGSTDYDQSISSLLKENLDPMSLYEILAIEDVQKAADLFKPIYDQTKKRDGYVSLEVSPYIAFDKDKTIAEARRLWQTVARPNIMIKVPGTNEGIAALEELIAEGININVTLLFSKRVYEKVARTYIKGLSRFAAKGGDLSKVASVASFFISRIDSNVDKEISTKLEGETDPGKKELLSSLLGKVAVANARLAYQLYKQIIAEKEWQDLAKKGAMPQRLLWASTSTKNPKYRDVYYVEELIGPNTVDTIPPATYEAFRQHGIAAKTLESNIAQSEIIISNLEKVGISLEKICEQLVTDGVKLFADPFDKLLATLKEKGVAISEKKTDSLDYKLNNKDSDELKKKLIEWDKSKNLEKLWSKDSSLWTKQKEESWLGWLNIVDEQLAQLDKLKALSKDIKNAGFTNTLLIGMGGSSLGPAVLASAFGHVEDCPKFYMIDSTVPEQIKNIENKIDLAKTIFIISSKSGSTIEPNILKDYFFDKLKQLIGEKEAAKHFIAITDPGSQLEQIAKVEGFRNIFYGAPSIGGRYSILSNFGMIPAALLGIDIERFLNSAKTMVQSCATSVPSEKNPGAVLGIILGLMANQGKDKVTFIVSPPIVELGAWLEQLLAESTGKSGKGIIPIDRETIGPSSKYGEDRLFIYIRLKEKADAIQDKCVEDLEHAGCSVLRIELDNLYDLAKEFFRFEFATAVAGSIMGINPFDQPDVEASKIKARTIMANYENTGKLEYEKPVSTFSSNDTVIEFYSDEANWQAINKSKNKEIALSEILGHLTRIKQGDYLAILAYLNMNEQNEKVLQDMRMFLHNSLKIPTCLGFGPRYLHSTGQVYKGGPNTGVFLEITADDTIDLPVPGKKYTFGVVKTAQAVGDFQVLCERQRRALRMHIKGNLEKGLSRIEEAIKDAVQAKV